MMLFWQWSEQPVLRAPSCGSNLPEHLPAGSFERQIERATVTRTRCHPYQFAIEQRFHDQGNGRSVLSNEPSERGLRYSGICTNAGQRLVLRGRDAKLLAFFNEQSHRDLMNALEHESGSFAYFL